MLPTREEEQATQDKPFGSLVADCMSKPIVTADLISVLVRVCSIIASEVPLSLDLCIALKNKYLVKRLKAK